VPVVADATVQGIVIEGRVLRLARILRVSMIASPLRVIAETIGHSLRDVAVHVTLGVGVLLIYIAACLGVNLFGGNDPDHFGNLPVAFLTLFRIITTEESAYFMYPNMYGCNVYPVSIGNSEHTCHHPKAQPFMANLYFKLFFMTTSCVVVALLISIILDAREQIEEQIIGDKDKTTIDTEEIEAIRRQQKESSRAFNHQELLSMIRGVDGKIESQRSDMAVVRSQLQRKGLA